MTWESPMLWDMVFLHHKLTNQKLIKSENPRWRLTWTRIPISLGDKTKKAISGLGVYTSGKHNCSETRYKLRKVDFPIFLFWASYLHSFLDWEWAAFPLDQGVCILWDHGHRPPPMKPSFIGEVIKWKYHSNVLTPPQRLEKNGFSCRRECILLQKNAFSCRKIRCLAENAFLHKMLGTLQETINKLKTTPTPYKNGSYGIKGEGGLYAIFLGPYAIFSVEIPWFLTDFYAIRTPNVCHILGAYFLQIWGWGWSELFSNHRQSQEGFEGARIKNVRNGQSTVGGPGWTKMDLFRPKWTKMDHIFVARMLKSSSPETRKP